MRPLRDDQLATLATPCFVFDELELAENFASFSRALRDAWSDEAFVAYSVKTNPFPWILDIAKREGCLAEVVSDEEYALALAAGYTACEIVFNGPIKSRDCFRYALTEGSIVNVDSWREIMWLEEFAADGDFAANVGLRVNFDLEAACPGETVTGASGGRFGFCRENGELARAVARVRALGGCVRIAGLHMHVTTRSRSLGVYEALARNAAEVIREFELNELDFVDIGGGFYGGGPKNVGAYERYASVIADLLSPVCDPSRTKLVVEPGGAVVCTPASYFGRVLDVKETTYDRFVTCDLSRINIDHEMKKTSYAYELHLRRNAVRPDVSCYRTPEAIGGDGGVGSGVPVEDRPSIPRQVLCGYTCMESDRLCALEGEPRLDVGDLVEIRNAGAYSMSFTPGFFIRYAPAVYALDGAGELSLKRCLRHAEVRAWPYCFTNKIEEEDVL